VDTKTGKPMAKVAMRPDIEIDPNEYAKMLELLEVSRSDEGFKVSTEPCRVKAHYGLKQYGKCYECTQDKLKPSPRKQAILNGESWYKPDKVCPHCNTFGMRSVHNGACRGCTGKNDNDTEDNRATDDSVMMRDNPNMLLSRADAEQYDMRVYRTGKPCKRGHTGWRYVSTGNCIDCLRGDK
jgi:hypothetical protein